MPRVGAGDGILHVGGLEVVCGGVGGVGGAVQWGVPLVSMVFYLCCGSDAAGGLRGHAGVANVLISMSLPAPQPGLHCAGVASHLPPSRGSDSGPLALTPTLGSSMGDLQVGMTAQRVLSFPGRGAHPTALGTQLLHFLGSPIDGKALLRGGTQLKLSGAACAADAALHSGGAG